MRRANPLRVLAATSILLIMLISGCVSTPSPVPATSTATQAVSVTPASTPVATFSPTLAATRGATPEVLPTAQILSPSSAGNVFSPTYRWEYGNVRWSFTMVIPEEVYEYYRQKPHPAGKSYASYAMGNDDRETIVDMALKLRESGDAHGYSSRDHVMNVVTFVQSLPYADDEVSSGVAEYPRYPVETLKDGTGDCEDKTILAASLLHSMGFDTVIFIFPNHSAAGVAVDGATGTGYDYGGKKYYYAETTSGSWDLGEVPDELAGLTPRVLPLVKSPVVKFDVTAVNGEAGDSGMVYSVKYTIKNEGPGIARGVTLRVRVLAPDRGENQLWQPERRIDLGDIGEDAAINGDTALIIPRGEMAMIVCELSGENVDTVAVNTKEFRALS